MNEEKIKRFVKDEAMVDAVFELIRSSFLKGRGLRGIDILAAERLAVDFLEDAWKELGKYRVNEDTVSPQIRQIGL